MASWADYPAAAVQRLAKASGLDGARDGLVRNGNGTRVNEREIAYVSHPGRELRVEVGGQLMVLGRIYLVRNRLYQMVVMSQKYKLDEAGARKYLQSFALLK